MKKLLVLLGKSILTLLSIIGVLMLVLEGWLIWHFEYDLGIPSESQLADLPTTGHLCSASPDTPYVPLAEIPPVLHKTVLVAKDLEFYDRLHASPLVQLVFAADHRNPWSAITLSVSKNCLKVLKPSCCSGQPNLDWQIAGIIFIGRTERVLSRDRILESYLNDSHFGGGIYGVAAGATAYFGKTVGALDIDEIAFLVAHIGQPYLTGDRAKVRRDFTIDRMHAAGLIDEVHANAAKAAPLPWLDNQPRDL